MYAYFMPFFPREGYMVLQHLEIDISLYQGSEVEIKKICSFGNDSSSMATSSSTRNSTMSSTKTKDFLDLADWKSKSNS